MKGNMYYSFKRL